MHVRYGVMGLCPIVIQSYSADARTVGKAVFPSEVNPKFSNIPGVKRLGKHVSNNSAPTRRTMPTADYLRFKRAAATLPNAISVSRVIIEKYFGVIWFATIPSQSLAPLDRRR